MTDRIGLPPEPPRYPCPTGRHHAHPGLTCDEYEKWRADILAAITPRDQR